jgi:hypothetical protein
MDAVVNYLSFQFNPLPQTFFTGIHRLDPGHFAVIDLADPAFHPERYWRYEFAEDVDDESLLIDQVRSVLEDSVEHHLIADVPVGAFLSGGVDSAITVTLVQEQRRALGLDPVKTFTVGFEAVSEHAEAREVERHNRLHPQAEPRTSHLQRQLPGDAPVVAVSDWVRAWPSAIAPYLDARLVVLGTDGFGRSDTRAALRRFFEVTAQHVVLAALDALARQGRGGRDRVAQAIDRYGIAADATVPWTS